MWLVSGTALLLSLSLQPHVGGSQVDCNTWYSPKARAEHGLPPQNTMQNKGWLLHVLSLMLGKWPQREGRTELLLSVGGGVHGLWWWTLYLSSWKLLCISPQYFPLSALIFPTLCSESLHLSLSWESWADPRVAFKYFYWYEIECIWRQSISTLGGKKDWKNLNLGLLKSTSALNVMIYQDQQEVTANQICLKTSDNILLSDKLI